MRLKMLMLVAGVWGLVGMGCPAVAAEDEDRRKERDAFWAEVSRAVAAGDFEAYKATCHEEGVLVSGTKETSYPLAEALERWKRGILDTAAGKMKARVEFRFSQRLGDGSTAHETGIFHYWMEDGTGAATSEYVHFEALLVKKGGWKTMMEYQKAKASEAEWKELGSAKE